MRTETATPRLLLAIETTGSGCSAALIQDDGAMIAGDRIALRHGHAEALVPLIDRVMATAGRAPAQLGTIAAATGPGSFTGIRVGLAAAQGIALATGARLIGVTSFAAVAGSIGPEASHATDALLVALDSRRSDLYVQFFAAEGHRSLSPPAAILPENLADFVRRYAVGGRLLIAGDAAAQAAAALDGQFAVTILPDTVPDARGVAAAARRLSCAGAVSPGPPRALYLRPPDVSLPRRHPAATVPPA